MTAMEQKELLEYIKTAIGLESDVAIQQEIITRYNENSAVRKPQLHLEKEPKSPERPSIVEYHVDGVDLASLITGIPMVVCGLIGAMIALVIVGAVFLAPFFLRRNSIRKANEGKMRFYHTEGERYVEKLSKVREENSRITQKYRSDLALWEDDDTNNRSVLTQHLDETQSVLEKLYALDYIYPKYRTLPALTSIYEYLVTGRCEELSGPHGAYNLYEDEVRKDTVISQLNTVIANLEQIKQNQYMLYQQVKAIQKNTSVIASEITQIKGYTAAITQLSALNTYYSALTARNTGITAAYNLLN